MYLNRRVAIIYYWLKNNNGISACELLKFLAKPPVKTLAEQYIENIALKGSFYEIPSSIAKCNI